MDEYFGKEAADFTKRMVEGKRVRLEFDSANAHCGHKDRTPQRRTIAYVFLESGLMLNAESHYARLRLRLYTLSFCTDGGV
jgi:micrococcal nuclease